MINAPILTEFPEDRCAPNGGNISGISIVEVIRISDIVSLPSCACHSGGIVSDSIYLKSGSTAARYEFDHDAVSWKQDEVPSPHLSFYRHIIQGNRSKVSPELMTALMRLRLGRFILRLTDYNGYKWIIGNTTTPVTFRGNTEIQPERSGQNVGTFDWRCDQLRTACAHDGRILTIDCDSVSEDDFQAFGFTFNGSDFASITAPSSTANGLVGAIISYQDGTIQQLSGGTYQDGITETGGSYSPDSGPVALTPGTYQVTMPMSVTLIDGTSCGFILQYTLSYTFGCADVSTNDFSSVSFAFNGAGEFTGFLAPTSGSGIVASITSYDDGTIQQIAGGSYADTITETAGVYEPDGGPVTLSAGTYRITLPLSITLTDGQTCAFSYTQDIVVGSSIFDPTFFDPTIFA